ncbi:MAG: hypothetical protein OXR68_00985 [Alphaproteobacteria bacterium]|nr:hypothetical protein [Alphaproteobacteria bacterium]MDD9919185.1 hypothetical protein [Alphaproteobacteria bacterium]
MKLLILMNFENYLLAAYAIMGTISMFGYIPQIWTLVRSTGRSMSTPISTWSLWTVDALVSFLYAIFILKNIPTITLVGLDLCAALLITGLTIYNRFFRFKLIGATIPQRPSQNAA